MKEAASSGFFHFLRISKPVGRILQLLMYGRHPQPNRRPVLRQRAEQIVLTIVKAPHPMLGTICRPDFVLDFGVIQEMFTLMKEAGGLGLAAPQVGIDARLFVTSWGEVFVNPKIERAAIPCTVDEGCLSVPGVSRVMGRHHKIVLADGRQYAAGRAIVIQHELDHLNGILISDFEE